MHVPVDHPLRGFYRGLSGLIGLFHVVFGVIAFIQTSGMDFFDQRGERVVGLTANPAFAVVSIVFGLLVLAVVLIGRNLDTMPLVGLGVVLMLAGFIGLASIRNDINWFAFSITNVNVSFVLGLVLFTAGMYTAQSRGVHGRGKIATADH